MREGSVLSKLGGELFVTALHRTPVSAQPLFLKKLTVCRVLESALCHALTETQVGIIALALLECLRASYSSLP